MLWQQKYPIICMQCLINSTLHPIVLYATAMFCNYEKLWQQNDNIIVSFEKSLFDKGLLCQRSKRE